MAQLLPLGSTAAVSASKTIADGVTHTLVLTAGGDGTVQVQAQAGSGWRTVGTLFPAVSGAGQQITGPVVYRVSRMAGQLAGVESSE